MDEPKIVETAFGAVDAGVLKELKGAFPTSDLRRAADAIEARRLWLRDSLERLYGMARHLVDGEPPAMAAEEPIWQLAEEIADELDACAADFSRTTALVGRLARLRPPEQ
jgi:hypothetical protein